MKLLAFVDQHGSKEAVSEVMRKTRKYDPDFLVCAGDLTSWGNNLKKLIRMFNGLNKPLIIIPGNHEEESELKEICQKHNFVIYLHKGSYEINGFIFFGYGGGGFSREDEKFEQITKQFKKTIDDKKVILVCHAPVYKTKLDEIPALGYVGNNSIRKFVKDVQPKLVICGHIHENEEKEDKIGETLIVNPGRFGKIINI